MRLPKGQAAHHGARTDARADMSMGTGRTNDADHFHSSRGDRYRRYLSVDKRGRSCRRTFVSVSCVMFVLFLGLIMLYR